MQNDRLGVGGEATHGVGGKVADMAMRLGLNKKCALEKPQLFRLRPALSADRGVGGRATGKSAYRAPAFLDSLQSVI